MEGKGGWEGEGLVGEWGWCGLQGSSNMHGSFLGGGKREGRGAGLSIHPVPPLLLPDAHKACAQAQQKAQAHQHTDGHIDARVHMVCGWRLPARVWGWAALSWGWRQRGGIGCWGWHCCVEVCLGVSHTGIAAGEV